MPQHVSDRSAYRTFIVIFALAIGGFAIGTGEFSVMGILPDFAADMHISNSEASHVISAYAIGVVVGAPLLAILGARLSRRTLLLLLMGFFCFGNLISALAPSYLGLILCRFISGLPHGAYFGIASLVAASMVPPNKRTQAVARVMTGLTVATVLGVPMASWLGLNLGWRWSFVLIMALGVLAVGLLWYFSPDDKEHAPSNAAQELQALTRRQVWYALLTGAVGFGGIFSIYAYIGPTLLNATHVSKNMEPVILMVFGCGFIVGNLAASWFADRALAPTIIGTLIWSMVTCLVFSFSVTNIWLVGGAAFLVGCNVALSPSVQTRLMDVAGHSQSLAAALNHSAFNLANALGPWLAGLALDAGLGWRAPGQVGALLALGGLVIFLVSIADERRSSHKA